MVRPQSRGPNAFSKRSQRAQEKGEGYSCGPLHGILEAYIRYENVYI